MAIVIIITIRLIVVISNNDEGLTIIIFVLLNYIRFLYNHIQNVFCMLDALRLSLQFWH
jgi:hypothetical protein